MKILICGLGSIGKRHQKILKKVKSDVIISAYRSGCSHTDTALEIEKEFFDLEEALNDNPDGVIISNPTSLHINIALKVAERGIPLFIEKPLSHSFDCIDEFRMVCNKNKVDVLVGSNLLFHPSVIKIKSLLEQESVGRILCARSMFGTFMPSWHPWENYKSSYASRSELGGGVTLTSIHEISYVTYLFGDVLELLAMKVERNALDIAVDEGVEILIKHINKIVSNIHLNFFQQPNHRDFEIICTKGTIYWDFWKPEIQIKKASSTETIYLGKSSYDLLDTSYEEQMRHFISLVYKEVESKVDLDKGIKDLTIALDVLKKIGQLTETRGD